jgi:hypothetical protein
MPAWPTTDSEGQHPFGTGLFWAEYQEFDSIGLTTHVPPTAPAVGTPLGLRLGVAGGLPVAGEPWAEIGLMTRVTAPERTAGDTKVTHLKSPSRAHEYVPGYIEGGTNTFRLIHSVASHELVQALAPNANIQEQRVWFAIQYADGPVEYFKGYIKSQPVEVTDGDDPVAIDVTIKVSGDVRTVFP